MPRFNVSSGPVVADYVTADREEELLRVLDAIGARDVVVGPEGNRAEITFVLDAENSDAAVRTAVEWRPTRPRPFYTPSCIPSSWRARPRWSQEDREGEPRLTPLP